MNRLTVSLGWNIGTIQLKSSHQFCRIVMRYLFLTSLQIQVALELRAARCGLVTPKADRPLFQLVDWNKQQEGYQLADWHAFPFSQDFQPLLQTLRQIQVDSVGYAFLGTLTLLFLS